MTQNNYKSIATFMHLGIFSKYFIPFGNYIIPLLLWTTNKDKSDFIDRHGKEAINFQLSILLYTLVLSLISVPFFLFSLFGELSLTEFINFNDIQLDFSDGGGGFATLIGASFIGLIALIGFFVEIVCIIQAAIRANKGESYQYPLTIHFIK